MAQTKKSVSEFIQDAFCPMIAVLCSYDAESICRKNNLTFAELIQPFCRLPSEVSYRDPSNNLIVLKNLRLDIKDFNALPPQNTLAKKLLNDAVSQALSTGNNHHEKTIETEQYQFQIRATTPWFDAWRDCFLRIIYGGDHEFLKNYVACVMVVSTSHLDPMDAFAKLVQQQTLQQQQSPSKPPKWFMSNIYKYFVLLHDVTEGEESKATSIFADLKQQYGAGNCHLLQINSKRAGQSNLDQDSLTNMPDPWRQYVKQNSGIAQQQQLVSKKDSSISDSLSNLSELIDQELNLNTSVSHPLSLSESSTSDLASMTTDEGYDAASVNTVSTIIHGACLTLSDHERIHVFMGEFVTKGLLPYVETNLKAFNEQITSRRGITKLFSMPKKFFGSGSTSAAKSQSSSSGTSVGSDSMEVVLRRAGDLAFLFQNYEFAYGSYHAAKRDVSREQAPTFCAGALEMSALANFMQESSASKAYPAQYMDEAIDIYSLVARLPTFATRAVLMSTEILKTKESYDQAVQQFLKLSQEDSDLRSALFLEQASHCFLNYRPPYIRKYAFYMVIAGHRYLKAGQRLHALRCYHDVLSIYGKPQWALAMDHVNFTLAKQSAQLHHNNDALTSFNSLFSPQNRVQSAQQQINFFKEYLTAFNQLTSSQTALPELPVPVVDNSSIKVLLAGRQTERMDGHVSNCNGFDFDETRDIWSDLERTITALDRRASGTRTQMSLFTNRTHNQHNPIAVANETVRIEFQIRNTLQVPLLLSELQVLWKYSSTGSKRKASVSTENVEETTRESTNDTVAKQTDLPVECDVLSDSVILPNDSTKVELSFRPGRAGFVTILGFSYRLNILVQNISDQSSWPFGVLGKTLFSVKGNRLNSNRKERLNVMYAVDRRLELQVVPEAPLLQVELSPLPAEMFCGEIQSCLVHLINTSSAHSISRVRLATSQPHLITTSTSTEENLFVPTDQNQANWTHPLHQPPSSILNLVTQHHPLPANSTRTIRLWIRASPLVGRMNVDFLFLYESDTLQQPLRHRTVKHSSCFETTHSLAINSQCQATGLGEMILPIQIDNLMATTNPFNIRVEQLSTISRQWNIENLSPLSKSEIRYGESLSIVFKCVHRDPHGTLAIKNISFDEKKASKYIDVSQHPLVEFFHHFLSENEPVRPTHRHKASTSIPIPTLSLVLLWQIEISNPNGENEIRHGLHLLSPTIEPVPNGEQALPEMIQYDLVYPSIVEHKFPKSLILPVELKLFNRTHENVQLQLQLLRTASDSNPLLSCCCLWCGMTEQHLSLAASSHLSVPLRACFFKAGLYSLGNLTINIVKTSNTSPIPIQSNGHDYFVDIRTPSNS